MDEDASLSDFLETGADESDAETDDTASDEGESPADSAVSDGAEPPTDGDTRAEEPPAENGPRATTTYAWDGAGAACESCGEVVERRWQQAGELVCVACKSW